jgi:phage terminase small subunit
LDNKRRRFVEEYRLDWNTTDAARRQGTAPKSAKEQPSRLLTFVNVQEALAELTQEDAARCQVSVDHAMAELVKVAFVNMLDYMRIGATPTPRSQCPPSPRNNIRDPSATQAAHQAGYSAKSARTDGPRMLSNAVVQEALAEIMRERAGPVNARRQALDLSADYEAKIS